TAFHNFRQNVGAISDKTDRKRMSIFARRLDHLQGFVERARDPVAITALQSFLNPGGINFHAEKNGAVHGRGQRLGAAHSAKAASQNEFTFKRSAEMFAAGGSKRFKCPLHDSLAPDVNP